MTLEAFISEYIGLLMSCFAAGWGIGFLIKMTRRYFEKI
jgi:hypothetical protein